LSTILSSHNTPVQSPPTRRGNKLVVWLWCGLLGLLALIVILALAGVAYQAVATQIDQRTYPAPGQMVDVGGYKLHIYCMGDVSEGSPTVILDHVGAANVAQWALVQPAVATTTRVCAYDRAGFGWSDPGPSPRDAQQNVRELHTLLTNADIPGPYVLVGHSFGGNVAQLYTATYPDAILGLVLVDPGKLFDTPGVPPDMNEAWKTEDQTIMHAAPVLARLGVMRLMALLGAIPGHGDLPAPFGPAFDALNLTTKFWDTLAAQNEAMPATSAEVLGIPPNLGALPLIVLSAEQSADRSRQVWTSLNTELAAHSTNGVHRMVAGSDHMSLALKQEHAQVTVDAILQVIEAVRTGHPLDQ
jgi:pimeloyl-ACP methyl ester carboxylesterase